MRNSHSLNRNADGASQGNPTDPNSKAACAFRNRGFCIFIDTIGDGVVPSVTSDKGKTCIFATCSAAEREIADNMMTRLQEFMDGERDFDDAMTVEEYVMEVDQMPDGSIVTEDGSTFR